MPRRDGTGPMGTGPLTGRQMGYCRTGRGFNATRFGRGLGLGLGLGVGRGIGRGIRRFALNDDYYMAPENEKSVLQNEKSILESQLKDIKERLDTLDKEE